MRTIVNYLVSHLRQEQDLVMNLLQGSSVDHIVAGYCLPGVPDEICLPDQRSVGILYADMVDYSRLREEGTAGARARLFESMEIFRSKITANLGRISHFTGDAILAEFEDTDSALHCAIQVQLSARQWNANLDLSHQVKYRIGVSPGAAVAERGDICARAVKLASSLEGLACAGGICVSHNMHPMFEAGSTIRFVATGRQYIKDTGRPVETFWILIDSDRVGSAPIDKMAVHRPAEASGPVS